jgi:hypothetical protein
MVNCKIRVKSCRRLPLKCWTFRALSKSEAKLSVEIENAKYHSVQFGISKTILFILKGGNGAAVGFFMWTNVGAYVFTVMKRKSY